jgi:hypothetical protein
VIIFISVHRNVFKGWLCKKSSFKGRHSLKKILVVQLVDVFIFFMVIFMGKLVKFCTAWPYGRRMGPNHAAPGKNGMDWLESIFEERMLVIWARRCDSLAPYSLDRNPCDSLMWSDLKEVFYKPLTYSLQELKDNIERLIKAIPEVMVRKMVYGLKMRAAILIQVEGTLQGDEISSKVNYE